MFRRTSPTPSYAGGAILLLTVLVTSFKTREYPPGEFARYNNLSEEDAKPMSFVGLMRNVPGVMVRLGVTQFFSWAGILAMPYAILSRAVEPRRMGVYMGIFNFTITVPQIVIGLTGGAIVKYCFASDAADMLALAGVFMLLAAVSVFLVKEHKAQ